MNYRTIANTVGIILQFEALFLIPSLIISLVHGETRSVYAFIISAVIALASGLLLHTFSAKTISSSMRARALQ